MSDTNHELSLAWRLVVAVVGLVVIAGLYLSFLVWQEHRSWVFRSSHVVHGFAALFVGFLVALVIAWAEPLSKTIQMARLSILIAAGIILIGACRYFLVGRPIGMNAVEALAPIVWQYAGVKLFFFFANELIKEGSLIEKS